MQSWIEHLLFLIHRAYDYCKLSMGSDLKCAMCMTDFLIMWISTKPIHSSQEIYIQFLYLFQMQNKYLVYKKTNRYHYLLYTIQVNCDRSYDDDRATKEFSIFVNELRYFILNYNFNRQIVFFLLLCVCAWFVVIRWFVLLNGYSIASIVLCLLMRQISTMFNIYSS